MSNLGIDAPGARPLEPCPERPAAVYHPPIRTSHLYGGLFFAPGAIPPPPPCRSPIRLSELSPYPYDCGCLKPSAPGYNVSLTLRCGEFRALPYGLIRSWLFCERTHRTRKG